MSTLLLTRSDVSRNLQALALLTDMREAPQRTRVPLHAEESDKVELPAELLQRSTFVCDSRSLALSSGMVGGAGPDESSIHAELGELIAGMRTGRTTPEQLTVFGMVGLPFQDLAAAWHVYQAALGDEEVRRVDFDA